MIRLENKDLHARYLGYNLNGCKEFENWLKKLGLIDLISKFTPYDFVKFGWIKPVLRVDIPESYYLTWKNFPEWTTDDQKLPETDKWALYCQPYLAITLNSRR